MRSLVFVVGATFGLLIGHVVYTNRPQNGTTTQKPISVELGDATFTLSEKPMDLVTDDTSEAGMPITPNLVLPKIGTQDSCAVSNNVHEEEGTPSIAISGCQDMIDKQ